MNDVASNFLQVLTQVVILFVLIFIGYVFGKFRLIGDKAAMDMATMVLYLATPAVIIVSFVREYDPSMMKKLLLMMALSALSMGLMIAIAWMFFGRKGDARKNRIYRFAVIFSNCGYMCLPLQQALLGKDGVFFGAAYVTIFNLFVWTYGLLDMSGNVREVSGKRLLVNPGIIGITIGMLIFLFSIPLPTVILTPINHLANLNTPIPMMLVGYHLSKSSLLPALKNARHYLCIALRLLICPAVIVVLFYLCGVRGMLLITLAVSLSAPVAAVTTMFASKYNQDVALSVQLTSLSTILSLITMPVVVSLTQLIA